MASGNVSRMLKQKKIPHEERLINLPQGVTDGMHVAEQLGVSPKMVFKTLVLSDGHGTHYVAMVPVDAKLDLKACATAFGVRKLEMIPLKELFPLTGYVHGGCSPLLMKKSFLTILDASALSQSEIYFSGGRIGCQILMKPEQLADLIDLRIAKITQ